MRTSITAFVFFLFIFVSCSLQSENVGVKNKLKFKVIFQKIFRIPEDDGGGSCAGCTLGVGLIEQLSQVQNQTVLQVLEQICNLFPSQLQPECHVLVSLFGPVIVEMLENNETPDTVCNQLGICTNLECRLFPPPSVPHKRPRNYNIPKNFVIPSNIPEYIWPWDKVANHRPFFDNDNDSFSIYETLRGYDWRGADCNDLDSNIYPGRQVSNFPDTVDHNCNGIFGHNENGTSWEEILCKETPQWGYILLGDSAGAHFHIPPEWLMARLINQDTYSDLIPILENELDWPMQSAATGFQNSTFVGRPLGPLNSGYLNMRNLNYCMHRDYQNGAVNGGSSSNMLEIMIAIARNQTFDNPVHLWYAVIGNDVCDHHHSIDYMTTPQQFYENVVTALKYLDTILPSGSHINFVGLVDGRILYNAMHDRIHPIGSTNNDVTYANFYDFLNCLDISPCFGWMNTNETWRNITSERAAELSKVYEVIIANNTFKNFDMHYFDMPLQQVIDDWLAKGGQTWQLIEPVDGFHPTQVSDALCSDVLFSQLQERGLAPPENPNNALIEKLFGDQGGYVPQDRKRR